MSRFSVGASGERLGTFKKPEVKLNAAFDAPDTDIFGSYLGFYE